MMNNILIAKILINQKEGSVVYIIAIGQIVFAIFSIHKFIVPYFGIYSEEIILIPIILNRLQCKFYIYLRIIVSLTVVMTANHHYFTIILNSVSTNFFSFEIVHMLPSILIPCDFSCFNRSSGPPVYQTANYKNSIVSRNRGIPGNTE